MIPTNTMLAQPSNNYNNNNNNNKMTARMMSTTTRRMIGILCCWSLLLPTVGVFGWVSPKSSSKLTPSTKQGPNQTTKTTTAKTSATSKNPLFYKNNGACCDASATKPFVPGFQSAGEQIQQNLSSASTIPWIQQEADDGDSHSDHAFFSHWNWQLEYFRSHLTNLRVNSNEDEIDDLYCMDDGSKRLYTISLSSDEYRDIRMTYMDFPSCKTIRCLAYPSDGKLPILGMGLMKFGKHQHLAVLDYQPLPAAAQKDIQDAYVSELLRMRDEIPSLGQPHTFRHFVTEERKYFTDSPLYGKWTDHATNGDEADEDTTTTTSWLGDLQCAQREFVRTHVRLTQSLIDTEESGNESSQPDRVVQLHSDFDTEVSRKEPAGPMLVAAFGPELAHRLVHEVIFPLSRNEPEPATEQH
mmetsp:Transcript_28343/g.66546  ORF Transcript_28343/g.66546 Transcript_28343/m.66546 type:complete len:412 (-) Transcript_28343:348-1583(-)